MQLKKIKISYGDIFWNRFIKLEWFRTVNISPAAAVIITIPLFPWVPAPEPYTLPATGVPFWNSEKVDSILVKELLQESYELTKSKK